MKNKHVVMALVAGWLISMVFPPSKVLGMFGKKSG